MQQSFGNILGRLTAPALGVLLLGFGLFGAVAGERNITLLPGTDLPGFDYSVIKDVPLETCESTCLADGNCEAFTYNQKANWCFLKSEAGPETEFGSAISGIVEMSSTFEEIAEARLGELPFLATTSFVGAASRFAAELDITNPPPEGVNYGDLIVFADAQQARANFPEAINAYRQALAIADKDPMVWGKLASAALDYFDAQKTNNRTDYEASEIAILAALNGFLLTETPSERAEALAMFAHALTRREMWRQSIFTYRASLALVDDRALQERLDEVVAEHGFRVVSNEVDSEAASPRICAIFSDPLPSGNTDLSDYVVVANSPRVAIETERNQICIEGLSHGSRYEIKLRAGLPSADGEVLRKDIELSIFVPDRSPFVGFANDAYVLPAGLGGGLPITSINAKIADIAIYRIGDRSIASAVRNGIFQDTLSEYSAQDIADQYGEKSWEGQVDLARGTVNTMTTTSIPVSDVLTDIEPGAYVITAKIPGAQQAYWRDVATQWFIVTDLGLTSVAGEDGVHAFVRSLNSAEPVVDAKVRLVAVNNEILGEARTDSDGRVDFAPGLSRGTGGRAPQLLVAETEAGDYVFLDISKAAFDLTDRGVDGRPSPGPLDLFATTERGVYRPGETVFVTALLRDAGARAVVALPLTMEIERPDGVVAQRELLEDQGAGGYFTAVPLVAEAMRGSWNIRLFVDPEASPLANVNFLVEDFEPERLALEISAPDGPVRPGKITPVSIAAKYLYGATAPGLGVEADVVLRPTSSLDTYPGYVFGRNDDPVETQREPLGLVGTTDEEGNVTAEVIVPEPRTTTRPMIAQLLLRLRDSNGRTIERSLSRPVLADMERIGIKPGFEPGSGPARGSEAGFEIISVAPDGETTAIDGVGWTLSRIETDYQWYREGGSWKWEAISTSRQVANGTLDTRADGPVSISASVDWGRYRLEVESAGTDPASSSYEFYAGYYFADAGSDTPDTLQVALDKSSYRIGDTAVLRLEPQFAGTALVMVVDNAIIDMRAVAVPAEGVSVSLPVTAEWGPGAYVTAMLYRPASVAERRMPARALGLAFADIDPGESLLNVELDAPAEALPRQPVKAIISIDNVAAGQSAYVAVAAVDLGILNLTNFKVPNPAGWYFGQRQLGMELRDLYGQLIDPTQGSPGALRSGGDGAATRLGTPPATSVLVALHKGIVEVDAEGKAEISFDMPDFSGTVRLMAMAWTETGVGHSSADIIVRDPVVVTLSPPRFLRVDDQSRLLVEINNIAGPAGTYRIDISSDDGLSLDTEKTSVELATGERTALDLGLVGTAAGDHQLRLVITAPNGDALVKELTLGVRATAAPTTRSAYMVIEPGESLSLERDQFAGMMPNSGALTLALGPFARLDVPGLLLSLDRYPYGCAEQISSRAMPLLYLNEVASVLGLGTQEDIDKRIEGAIADLLAKQTSNGSFGLWGPFSYTDLWLDSYVTEFLLRAEAEGYDVPDEAMTRALDNLSNQLSYAADFSNGGEDVAYALYDLARAGRASIGDLRYYLEARLDAFATPLAKAQLGAALALYGDRTRAAKAFEAAIAELKAPLATGYRSDYGSRLRDLAGVLALAAEFEPTGINVGSLATRLGALRQRATYSSTQEDAWTLVAAAAMARETGDGAISINGISMGGDVYQRYDQEEIESGAVVIVNNDNKPLEVKISVTGTPSSPPPASSNGFALSREYFLPDGTRFDPGLSQISQNDRFVVVLRAQADSLGSGQFVIADPLPAGFEIENPDLSAGSGVADLSWLSVNTPIHVESRTDQFVAAFRYGNNPDSFSTAYMVRAVSPGVFTLPGATIEDMYQPELRANTDGGNIEVIATGQ